MAEELVKRNVEILSSVKTYARYAFPAIRMRLYRELRRGALWERALAPRYRLMSDGRLAGRLEALMDRFTPAVRRYAREFASLYRLWSRAEQWVKELEKIAAEEPEKAFEELRRFTGHELRVLAGTRGAVVRYYPTMRGWIRAIDEMLKKLREKIRELGKIGRWIPFRITIGFRYVRRETEKTVRNIEAHLDSECRYEDAVMAEAKVKGYHALVGLIKSPEWAPRYTLPLLVYDEEFRKGLRERDKDKVSRTEKEWEGTGEWSWGVEWFREKAVFKVVESVTIKAEIYDYDYAEVRRYASSDFPPEWWKMTVREIVYRLRATATVVKKK